MNEYFFNSHGCPSLEMLTNFFVKRIGKKIFSGTKIPKKVQLLSFLLYIYFLQNRNTEKSHKSFVLHSVSEKYSTKQTMAKSKQ